MTITFDTNIWQQQRTVLSVVDFTSATTAVRLTVTDHAELTAYYSVKVGVRLDIDLSDLVRMYNRGTLTIAEMAGDTVVTQVSRTWTYKGLINPEKAFIPETDVAFGGCIISPPSRMYYAGVNLWCETYFTTDYSLWTLSGGRATFRESGRRIVCSGTFTMTDGGTQKVCNVETGCGDMVNVQWRSFTGSMRRHAFELVKYTTEAVDVVQLQTMTDGYEVQKGRRDSFTIRIDGLNRYDMWYYGDIITSSDVQVSLDNGTTWEKVQVTSKSVELPSNDEGALGTLEITLNYRHYDTL